MSKYKILWVIPLFFIISICGVLYFQKNISNEMSRFEIAYINNHLIINIGRKSLKRVILKMNQEKPMVLIYQTM